MTDQDVSQVVAGQGIKTIALLPEEIVLPVETDVRGLKDMSVPDRRAYDQEVERLSASIAAEGQIEPLVVMESQPNGDGKTEYLLIAGRRRLAAITRINQERGKKGEKLKAECVVRQGLSGDQQFRMAIVENVHRENFNGMRFAELVQTIRANNGWDTPSGLLKVADYLKVSEATVRQSNKIFEKASDTVKRRLRSGEISTQTALELIKEEDKAQQDAMLAAADQEREARLAAKKAQQEAEGKKPRGGKREQERQEAKATGKSKEDKTNAGDVKKARARKQGKVEEGPAHLSKGEILAAVTKWSRDETHNADSAARKFLRAFLMFAAGEMTISTCQDKFNDAVEKSARGSAKDPKFDRWDRLGKEDWAKKLEKEAKEAEKALK